MPSLPAVAVAKHIRPHEKPRPPDVHPDSSEPCGPGCWLLDPTSRQLIEEQLIQKQADDAAAAAAAGIAGADSGMEDEAAETAASLSTAGANGASRDALEQGASNEGANPVVAWQDQSGIR
jgi:hypothetical protein